MTDYNAIIDYPYKAGNISILRASQFAPFDALEGLKETINSTTKVKECRRIIFDEKSDSINEKLIIISKSKKEAEITYYDDICSFKYKTIKAGILKIDVIEGILTLNNNLKIRMENLYDIKEL